MTHHEVQSTLPPTGGVSPMGGWWVWRLPHARGRSPANGWRGGFPTPNTILLFFFLKKKKKNLVIYHFLFLNNANAVYGGQVAVLIGFDVEGR
jgi:hypothetical protein